MKDFTPRQSNQETLNELEQYYSSEVFDDMEKMENVWAQLHDFFKDKPPRQDFEFYDSYFRWYTDITWNMFNSWNKKFIEKIAISRQVFLASMLNYRLTDNILSFLGSRSIDEKETQNLFIKFREVFNNSEAIIYKNEDNNTFTIQDFLEKKKRLAKKEESMSLEKAKLLTQVKDNIDFNSNTIMENFGYADLEDAIDELAQLDNFFQSVDKEDIFVAAQSYLSPGLEEAYMEYVDKKLSDSEKGNNLKKAEDNFEENDTKKQLNKNKEKELNEVDIDKDKPEQNNLQSDEGANEQKKKKTQSDPDKGDKTKPEEENKKGQAQAEDKNEELKKAQENVEKNSSISFQEIKQTVDAQFDKDENGQYESIEGVMKVLDSIARQQDNDDIRNLYYFDQQDGKFKWDKDLLEKDE